jgi:hypothetical protein
MERCTQSRPLKDHAWISCGPHFVFVSRVISARVAFVKGDSSGAGTEEEMPKKRLLVRIKQHRRM